MGGDGLSEHAPHIDDPRAELDNHSCGKDAVSVFCFHIYNPFVILVCQALSP
jgi:hypothetical protein